MTIDNFADTVISLKNKNITDEVFLLIQNDSTLMKSYLRLVEEKGLDTVNSRIGRKVKEKYGLTNDDQRNNEPKSTLISSHQRFE